MVSGVTGDGPHVRRGAGLGVRRPKDATASGSVNSVGLTDLLPGTTPSLAGSGAAEPHGHGVGSWRSKDTRPSANDEELAELDAPSSSDLEDLETWCKTLDGASCIDEVAIFSATSIASNSAPPSCWLLFEGAL